MATRKTSPKYPEPNRTRDVQAIIRMREEDKRLLMDLAEQMDLSMTDVVLICIRAEARRRGMSVKHG
jgi:hypothetical protein